MCYSGHHLMVSGHFCCWVAGSFKYKAIEFITTTRQPLLIADS